jgi:OmpR family response regulator RpaB
LRSYNAKILLVEDEIKIYQILKIRLSKLGYQIIIANNGELALSLFTTENPDLIILDILLHKINGYDVCNKLRKKSQIPILLITALSAFSDRVLGLEIGADDYIVKPFSVKELEARIRSVLRRTFKNIPKPQDLNPVIIGTLIIDLTKRKIFKRNKLIRLTGLEFNLLHLLIQNNGELLSRAFILEYVWGYTPERYVDTRVVDVNISRLRAKLEENPSNPDLILTARSKGYMFQKFQDLNKSDFKIT